MQRLRVAHVITSLDVGGAQDWTMTCASMADRKRFETHVISGSHPNPSWTARLSAAGVSLHILPSLVWPISPANDARALRSISRILCDERFDVIHTHMSKAGILGRLAGRLSVTPLVIHTAHGWSLCYSPHGGVRGAVRICERTAFDWADRVLVGCENDALAGSTLLRVDRSRFTVLREGVALPGIDDEPKGATRERIEVEAKIPLIGTVTRLVANKRLGDLIKATAAVRTVVPNVVCVIVGSGPEEARLRELAERAAPGGVRFLGAVDDASSIYPMFDVFVHTSAYEGLPRAIMHAMANRTAVVAQDVGGIRELVRHGATGWLVPPGNVQELAYAIVHGLEDRAEAQRRALAARALIEDAYDLEPAVRAVEHLYLEGSAASARKR